MESKTFRRFIQIGTDEKMNRLSDLVESKGLSRDDLILILETIKLNHDIFYDIFQLADVKQCDKGGDS